MKAFMRISDGKVEVEDLAVLREQREPALFATDEPERFAKFLDDHGVEHIMCSSSVDFPEEYGIERTALDAFFKAARELRKPASEEAE